MRKTLKVVMALLAIILITALAGCGGGGTNGTGPSTGNATTTYSVSGTIVVNGVALSGVTVNTAGTSVITDLNGKYVLSGLSNGSYTVTPVKSNYSMVPVSRTVVVNGVDMPGNDFTATLIAVPGTGQDGAN